jgi:hypothetical protein
VEAKADAGNAASADHDLGAPLLITPGPTATSIEASAAPAQAIEPVAPATRTRAQPAGGGPSFTIRLASSLRESDARLTLSQLQKEFPGTLQGGSVTRDNLGSYGVFYRVRVGPMSREAADKICSRLRAAGHKCVPMRG